VIRGPSFAFDFETWRRAECTMVIEGSGSFCVVQGRLVNKKLVYRLYCEEGLGIWWRKPCRRKNVQVREAPAAERTAQREWEHGLHIGSVGWRAAVSAADVRR